MNSKVLKFVAIVLSIVLATSAVAQAGKKRSKSRIAGQSVSKSTFKVITEVQKLMEEEKFNEAIATLEVLVRETRDNAYDHAVANQYLAHNSVMLDDIPRARSALQAALSAPELPPDMSSELRLFYGSILLGDEEYALARENLEIWLANAASPQPKQLFSVGYANYQDGRVQRGEELLARAINEGGAQAQDSWYQVYYQILFDLKKYRLGKQVLYELISRSPNKALNWRMLASHHMQLDQSNDALAAMMLLYLNGQVESNNDLRQIVSLYGFLDIPDKAARMLEKFVAEGKIEDNSDTKKELGNLWLMARERAKAKEAYQAAASVAPDGRTYVMLGGIFFEDEEWRSAHESYQKALNYGGLEEPLRVYLLAGISAFRGGMEEEARVALREAAKSPEFRAQARSLIKKLDEA